MGRYDCVVLYNTVLCSEVAGSREKVYPSTVIREEVGVIEEALRKAGFSPYLLSVDHFSGSLVDTLAKIAPKFVFNLCEEINGKCEQEMCVAALLDMMAIPYSGSGPLALALALNKYRVKQLLRSAGIPVAPGYLHRIGASSVPGNLKLPVIVKPVHEDASLGINSGAVCCDQEALLRQVSYVHSVYRQDALVERFLEGREFNVSIIGERDPRVLAISEIDFSGMPEGEPRIVSYRAKWDEDSPMYQGTVPVCPAVVTKRLEDRLRDTALRSYLLVGCRDYGRVDLRTDARGNVYVLEVNPNPDISPRAGFARAARQAGFSYEEIILWISRAAMGRSASVASTVYAFD